MKDGRFSFHVREPGPGDPGGVTVARGPDLPGGTFQLDEFSQGPLTLWFVTEHEFDADERQACFDIAWATASRLTEDLT